MKRKICYIIAMLLVMTFAGNAQKTVFQNLTWEQAAELAQKENSGQIEVFGHFLSIQGAGGGDEHGVIAIFFRPQLVGGSGLGAILEVKELLLLIGGQPLSRGVVDVGNVEAHAVGVVGHEVGVGNFAVCVLGVGEILHAKGHQILAGGGVAVVHILHGHLGLLTGGGNEQLAVYGNHVRHGDMHVDIAEGKGNCLPIGIAAVFTKCGNGISYNICVILF